MIIFSNKQTILEQNKPIVLRVPKIGTFCLMPQLKSPQTNEEHDDTQNTSVETPQKPTPLPKLQMLVVCIIVFSESFGLTSIVPMLPFMVRDFGMTDDEKRVGTYAGMLTACFPLALAFSSLVLFLYCLTE